MAAAAAARVVVATPDTVAIAWLASLSSETSKMMAAASVQAYCIAGRVGAQLQLTAEALDRRIVGLSAVSVVVVVVADSSTYSAIDMADIAAEKKSHKTEKKDPQKELE